MSIYRGAGGAGDAVADSSSEALLVRELAIEVQADADAAAASATAAANSASTASTAATNAQTAETNAETAETNAETAEANAETAQAAAEAAQLAAETAQTAAELAETNAETAETNAETAATNAASSASAASTSATNAAASASAASTSATNASNSASAASTSASNASTSATAAAGSASSASTSASNAATSETNAAASASSASTSATTATTQAGIATTQASNAASSASAASTSASNASSSASAASTSASNAATSATNADNSATAAATSESNAAASAAAAAASYDNFDDRYLGSKSADPTLDNDGNALVTGALYYNDGTVTPADKGMYVYDGTQWIAASAASTAILTVFKYTATASQTTFTGADDNSLTLTYTAGSVIVTVNGAVMEIGTDVTASNGTSIVLAQAALANDEVNIYAFATFNIANTYTQAQVDAGFLPKANPTYTGTLTGGTGVVNLGSGQFYKDASGQVGIGTSSPNYKLDVAGNTQIRGNISTDLQPVSAWTANTRALQLTTYGSVSSNDGIGFVSLATNAYESSDSSWKRVAGTSAALYQISYTGEHNWYATTAAAADSAISWSERMRIPATGGLQIVNSVSVGNATPSASGAGITFPATQSASSDANTLDDYEEGTWTPTIEGTSTAGTATYANQNGRYTKIGRLVYFEFYLNWSSGTGTGNLQFGGLPFASGAASTYSSYAIGYWDSIAITSGQIPMCFSGNSSTKINFSAMNAGGAGTGTISYDANGAVQISGCYTV